MTNNTLNVVSDSSVIYFGLNGYGITWGYLLLNTAMAVIAILGMFLNAVSVWFIRKEGCGMDISVIFISNLSCSDFLNDIVCLYLVTYSVVHYKNYYECAFRFGLAIGINFNSVLQLMALTVDRFIKIIYPFEYVRICQEKTAKSFHAFSWIFSGILCILPVLGVRKQSENGLAYCSFFGVLDDSYLILMTACYFMVFAILVLCYSQIFSASLVQNKRLCGHSRMRHLWMKPTKTVIILIFFYCLLWVPLGTCILLHLTGTFPASFTDDRKGTILTYCGSLVFLDTVVNPAIYGLKIKTVKQKWKTLLKACFKQELSL